MKITTTISEANGKTVIVLYSPENVTDFATDRETESNEDQLLCTKDLFT